MVSYGLARGTTAILAGLFVLTVYVGLRWTGIPNGYLSLSIIPVGAVAFGLLCCRREVLRSEAEWCGLAFLLLFVTGAFGSTPHGPEISVSGVASAMILVASYWTARALVTFRMDWQIAALAFALVAVPVLAMVGTGGVLRLRDFFTGSSENYVSSWCIITAATMASAAYARKGKASVLPFILTAFIAFSQFARASIALALLGAAILVYQRFGLGKILLAAVLACVPAAIYLDAIYLELFDLYTNTRFASAGLESPRWEMWRQYLDRLDAVSMLFGMDVMYVPAIHQLSDNPHSSFFRFHSFYGLVPLALVPMFLACALWRASLFHVAMLGVILLRASTDILLVGMYFDLMFMVVLVNALESCAKRRVSVVAVRSGAPAEMVPGE